MFELISLFFPTFISLNIIKKRKKIDYKNLLIKYPLYNIFINIVVCLIIVIYKKTNYTLINENFNIIEFNLKYIFLALIVAFIAPYIQEFLQKNINFKLEFLKGK